MTDAERRRENAKAARREWKRKQSEKEAKRLARLAANKAAKEAALAQQAKAVPGGEGVANSEPPVALSIGPLPHVILPANAFYLGEEAVMQGYCLNPRVIWVLWKGKKVTARLQRGSPKFSRGAKIRVKEDTEGKLEVVGRYTRWGVAVPERKRTPAGANEALVSVPTAEGVEVAPADPTLFSLSENLEAEAALSPVGVENPVNEPESANLGAVEEDPDASKQMGE